MSTLIRKLSQAQFIQVIDYLRQLASGSGNGSLSESEIALKLGQMIGVDISTATTRRYIRDFNIPITFKSSPTRKRGISRTTLARFNTLESRIASLEERLSTSEKVLKSITE